MSRYSSFFRLFLNTTLNQQRLKLVTVVSSIGLSATALLWYQREYQANSYSTQLKRYPALSEYPQLTRHSNLMANYLTPQMYAKLRDRITKSGYTIDDVIQVGVDNPGAPSRQYFGVSAGDEETYKMFSDLFDPLIKAKFNYGPEARQTHDIDVNKLRFPFESETNFDINKYILSSRIRVTRNLSGFTFPTFCTRAERRKVENKLSKAFDQVQRAESVFNGNYYRLSNIDERLQNKLVNDGVYLYKPQTMSWLSSGVPRDWPDARALFVNHDKTIFAWINQKDHLRLISWSTNNGKIDLFSVIKKFFQGLTALENTLKQDDVSFAHDDHFGYLTTCPANIGTGLKYNVFMKLPLLSQHNQLAGIMKTLNLRMDEIMDPDVETFKDCLDISNIDRIGKTEIEIIQHVLNGIEKLIEMERHLESGKKLEEFIKKN